MLIETRNSQITKNKAIISLVLMKCLRVAGIPPDYLSLILSGGSIQGAEILVTPLSNIK